MPLSVTCGPRKVYDKLCFFGVDCVGRESLSICMNSTASKAHAFILDAISAGKTVYISTMTKVTAISPATFARWEKSGHPLFKVAADGNLMLASGRSYGRITTDGMMLVGLSAS